MSIIVHTIDNYQITALDMVPSMLEPFFSEEDIEDRTQSLRVAFIGGEAVPENIKHKFLHDRWSRILQHVYGPTETTMVTVSWNKHNSICDPTHFSLGKTLSNVTSYIVDDSFNIVPVGVAGELLLGGLGIARGYLNRPSLTAEKFIPNLFEANPHDSRLYRTGGTFYFATHTFYHHHALTTFVVWQILCD